MGKSHSAAPARQQAGFHPATGGAPPKRSTSLGENRRAADARGFVSGPGVEPAEPVHSLCAGGTEHAVKTRTDESKELT